MTDVPPADLVTRRVCLRLKGMDAVTVRRDLSYGTVDGDPLLVDLYYPPNHTAGGPWPAVIIVAGYPETLEPRRLSRTYKDLGWTVSMARLIAASGMAAIAYTNRDPVRDLEALIEHVHEHATPWRVDASRIGVMAVSGNVPTALTAIMQDAPRPPSCAVFGCGCLLDLDGATDVADAAREFGFANPGAGRSIAHLRHDVPIFITRAGQDQFPAMNASIDRFMRHGIAANLPITFVNHAEGPHAFDLFDDSRTSRDIVRGTLEFLRQHLVREEES